MSLVASAPTGITMGKPKFAFNGTVTMGNVLTAFSMFIAVVGIYVKVNSRLDILEVKQSTVEQRLGALDETLKQLDKSETRLATLLDKVTARMTEGDRHISGK